MHRLCIVVLALAIATPAFCQPGQLNIDVTHKPEDCELKTKAGDKVAVHYVGRLTDGTEFDNSKNHGEPIEFDLGAGQVIEGWDQGLLDMCVGEKRKLTIPPHLGYGDAGAGPIPGGATLLFDVELMDILEPDDDGVGFDQYDGLEGGQYHGDAGAGEGHYAEFDGQEAQWDGTY